MPDPWYERVLADAPIMQGDFVFNCPLLAWKAEEPEIRGQGDAEELLDTCEVIAGDVVVMTQACDLEQSKVSEVVVCSIHTLTEVKATWEEHCRAGQQTPTDRAWRTFFDRICNGFIWNYAMLNRGEADGLQTEHRVADFHDIYTVPIKFLESIAAQRGPRLRLRPPYREHLSQAFARYFMRVGLPSSVEPPW